MPKAYSYVRFSSPEQAKGDSVRRQAELSAKYAEKHGLDLDAKLSMKDEGVSAYDRSNITKGALGQFLQLVNQGRVKKGSYLLVESLDRLSRDKVMDALTVFMDILRAGIIVVTLADDQVYSYEETNGNPMKLILSILVMSRANEESATKSRRNRAAWDNKRATISDKRLTARCPYWLKPSEGSRGFEVIPERAAIVRRIFQMSKDGLGTATIVKKLNEENVPTFSDKSDGWQTSYLQKVLSSTAVYGELQLNLQRDGVKTRLDAIPDYYPAVMTKEEWLLVAAIRSGRRTRGGVSKGQHLSNLFSGLLRCGYCGGPMNMGGHVSTKPNGEKRKSKYVACSRARRGMGCIYAQWEYTDLERNLLWYCASQEYENVLESGSDTERKSESIEMRILGLESEIHEQQDKLKQLMAALENGENAIAPKIVLQRIIAIEERLDVLIHEKQLAEKDAAKVNNEVAERSTRHQMILDIYAKLDELQGSELRYFRVMLSEMLRREIKLIEVKPVGNWLSEEQHQKVLDFAKANSASPEILESLAIREKKPRNPRSLLIHFNNGIRRAVVPDRNIEIDC